MSGFWSLRLNSHGPLGVKVKYFSDIKGCHEVNEMK